jgi:hypothetical protein
MLASQVGAHANTVSTENLGVKVYRLPSTGEAHHLGEPPLLLVTKLVDGYYIAMSTEELNFFMEQLNYSCTRVLANNKVLP